MSSPMPSDACDEPGRDMADPLSCTCTARIDCNCGARLRRMFEDNVLFNRVKLLTRMDKKISDDALLSSSSSHIWTMGNFTKFLQTNSRRRQEMLGHYWDCVPLVDNFLLCQETYLATDKNLDLHLALSRSENNITVVILINSSQDRPLFTRLEFAIVKNGLEDQTNTILTYDMVCETGTNTARVLLMKRWAVLNLANRWLQNDTVTLLITARARFLLSMTSKLDSSECQENVDEDVGGLMSTGKYSDIVIKSSDGVEFKAHKAILTSRSDYFASMFNHENICETKENLIQITDFDGNIVRKMLRYLYTGEVHCIDNCAFELIALADKYNMTELHSLCEDSLIRNLKTDNALDILRIAELYNAKVSAVKTRKFILKYSKHVMSGNKTELGDKLKALDSESLGELVSGIAALSSKKSRNAARRDYDSTPELIARFNTMEHLREIWIQNGGGAKIWHGKSMKPARLLGRCLRMEDVRINIQRWFRDNSGMYSNVHGGACWQ